LEVEPSAVSAAAADDSGSSARRRAAAAAFRTRRGVERANGDITRAVLAIPATIAPSERIFSAAGVVLNCKRCSLSQHVVDKVIFVHENGHLLEDV